MILLPHLYSCSRNHTFSWSVQKLMNFVIGLKWSEKHIMCLLNHRYLRSLSHYSLSPFFVALFTISVLCRIIHYLRSLSHYIHYLRSLSHYIHYLRSLSNNIIVLCARAPEHKRRTSAPWRRGIIPVSRRMCDR